MMIAAKRVKVQGVLLYPGLSDSNHFQNLSLQSPFVPPIVTFTILSFIILLFTL